VSPGELSAARSPRGSAPRVLLPRLLRLPKEIAGDREPDKKGGRVDYNIKGNDYGLIAELQYQAGVLVIRFFGSHAEYDRVDVETV
jgi:hypothetical protein